MDVLTMSIIGLVVGTVAYISGAIVTSYAGWKVYKTTKREEVIIKPIGSDENTPFVNMLIIEYRYLEPIERESDVWSVVERDDSLWANELFEDENWTMGYTTNLPEYTLVEGCDELNFFDYWSGKAAQYNESLFEDYEMMSNFLGFDKYVSENLVEECREILEPQELNGQSCMVWSLITDHKEPIGPEPATEKHIDEMNLKELQEFAKEMGIKTREKNRRLNKTELKNAIRNSVGLDSRGLPVC